MTYFNANIKILREVNNLTQSEIEQELGLSKGDWSTYENGKDPNLDVVHSIVKFFNKYHPHLIIDTIVVNDLSFLNPKKSSKSSDDSDNKELIDRIIASSKKKNKTATKFSDKEVETILKNEIIKDLIIDKIFNSLLDTPKR